MKIYREITPLNNKDAFVLSNYDNPTFDYPLHNHKEYELCLTLNCKGNRIVGDSVTKYSRKDLVLIGPYVYHRWDNSDMPEGLGKNSRTIVVQFDNELFESSLLQKEAFYPIKKMLLRSTRGIHFDEEIVDHVADRLLKLEHMDGFQGIIEFLSLLNFLATNSNQQLLTSTSFNAKPEELGNKRISDVYEFIMNNYTQRIKVTQASEIANMSESAFSHFFKKCTKKSFTQFVVELRIGLACKLLMETQDTISQICFNCGFNNISNFNRLFKKYKKTTPLQYRQKVEMVLQKPHSTNFRYLHES